MLWPTVSRQVFFGVRLHLGPKTRFFRVSCGFVDVGLPFCWKDGSVIYNCCWVSPEQSFSGPSPEGLMTIFYCLRFESPPQPGGPGPHIYIPQEQGGPVITLFFASHDSQGYGGGIRTRPHARKVLTYLSLGSPYMTCSNTCSLNRYVAAGDVSVIMSLYYLDDFQLIYNNLGRREWFHCCFRDLLLFRSRIYTDAGWGSTCRSGRTISANWWWQMVHI
jgi:hypothetical protein